ncbi:MAG: hypothetical protein ABI779_03930 [Acidobacteriota bacterium]
MNSKLILPVVVLALAAACGRDNVTRAGQKEYEVVQEGSASGVTATILGPGETLPPVTGTNADTTTAFGLDPNAAMPPQGTTGTFAGTTPAPYTPPAYTPPAPRAEPPAQRTEPQQTQRMDTERDERPVQPPTQTEPKPEPDPDLESTAPTTTGEATPIPAPQTEKEPKEGEDPPPTTTDTRGQ